MIYTTGANKHDNNQQPVMVSPMPIHKKADIQHDLKIEAVRALELSNRLHSTLDLNKLFNLFTDELLNHMNIDGISYRHPENAFQYDHGMQKTHKCQYRLLMGGDNLGEIEFSRRQRFTENETQAMEYMLSSLLNPLHNGLMYEQAVSNSLVDPLTGIKNRTAFDASLTREIALARRHKSPFALLVLDIDKFKDINDQYGHLFGDCVLRDVAKCISDVMRDSDMLFRYGGEEFVILLNNTSDQGAHLLAERIRKTVSKLECSYGGNTTSVTVSLGIACLNDIESETRLFDRADQALYTAKKQGRNQSVLAK